MPLLWEDRFVGWVNARVDGGKLTADVGYVRKRPRNREFTRALDAEMTSLERFLEPRRA
jgi:hypothetical protein